MIAILGAGAAYGIPWAIDKFGGQVRETFNETVENAVNTLQPSGADFPDLTVAADDVADHFYYQQLTEEEQTVYRELLQGVNDMEECILVHAGKMAGVLILKDSIQKKICTLRVWPEFRKMGIGHQLMTRAVYELNDERPLITVADDHVQEFSKLFLEYGFQCSQAYFGLYRKGHWEYVYNSTL